MQSPAAAVDVPIKVPNTTMITTMITVTASWRKGHSLDHLSMTERKKIKTSSSLCKLLKLYAPRMLAEDYINFTKFLRSSK